MIFRSKELAEQAIEEVKHTDPWVYKNYFHAPQGFLERFAMLVIQDYENDKRESRREVMSELGYSRIGRNNV